VPHTAGIAVIEAPSELGLRGSGVRLLPEALRRMGLLDALTGVDWAGHVDPPAGSVQRDPASGVLNVTSIAAFSRELASKLRAQLERRRFSLVLGGDCSVLIGVALALRRRGRYGLAFLDGHADFYSPAAEPSGEVASMELAVITGGEPAALADIDGLRPFLLEEDVVLLGTRDLEAALEEGSPDVRQTAMRVFDLETVRRWGAGRAAHRAVQVLSTPERDGFWIHLDADVLDDRIMPAVDYRLPGGLTSDELTEALAVLLSSPRAVGMTLTIYNPEQDDDSLSAGRVLVRAVRAAFGAAPVIA